MKHQPILDPTYLPMIEFERQYRAKADRLANEKNDENGIFRCVLSLTKNPNQIACQELRLSLAPELETETLLYLNRFIKSMLWLYGGYRLCANLPQRWADALQKSFSAEGEQRFDADFIGDQIFGRKLEIVSSEDLPHPRTESLSLGGKSDGLRLGFDLGGSDKKIAAIADGKLLFATSIIWDPYPQTDLRWHKREFAELLRLGKSKLPGPVEAVGGSVPGIVMDNQIKVGSLFRGIAGSLQRKESQNIFAAVAAECFGPVPYRLANDGDVTALAGALLLGKNNLLGIAMGTSEAAGYANAQGSINSWFSELAFVPVDMGPDKSQDEWSKDWGTGVEYFSQQAVIRLAPKVGIDLPQDLPKPKKLALVQQKLHEGHEGATQIFRTIGTYLGYALPWYHRFYEMENVSLLGRVLKGQGGKLIIDEAEKVLASEFPELGLQLVTLNDEEILHGQAMAAASLA